MKIEAFVLVNFVVIFGVKTVDGDSSTAGMGSLTQQLMENYNKEIMPSIPVEVSLNLLLFKIKSTVEREGTLESVVALFLEWTDSRVVWNPDDYGNLTHLTFDAENIWLPDIAMTNSADHIYAISKDTKFVIRAGYNGLFNFVPTGTALTWCELKLRTFPFDVQNCSIEFESWSLNSRTLIINNSSALIIDPNFRSLQFTLCEHGVRHYDYYYETTDEHFSRVRYDFILRRKSALYVINLIFPTAMLSFVESFVFFIPVKDSASDRIGFATTNMLALVVLQTIVMDEMPKTSDAVTVLSQYIIAMIILSSVGIFESVLIARVALLSTHAPPRWLSLVLKKICPVKIKRKHHTRLAMGIDLSNTSSSDDEFHHGHNSTAGICKTERRRASRQSGRRYCDDHDHDHDHHHADNYLPHVEFSEDHHRKRKRKGCFKATRLLCCPIDEFFHVHGCGCGVVNFAANKELHRAMTSAVIMGGNPAALPSRASLHRPPHSILKLSPTLSRRTTSSLSGQRSPSPVPKIVISPPPKEDGISVITQQSEILKQPFSVDEADATYFVGFNFEEEGSSSVKFFNPDDDDYNNDDDDAVVPDYELEQQRLYEERLQKRRLSIRAVRANKLLGRLNKENWEDVAARLDIVMFCVITLLSVLIPLGLFMPVTLFDSSCNVD